MTELVSTALVLAVPAPRLPVSGELVPARDMPPVVPGEVVREDVPVCVGRRLYNTPYRPPWAITDPVEILAIALRAEHYRKPWWKRMGTLPPSPGTATRAQLDKAARHLPLNLTIGRP